MSSSKNFAVIPLCDVPMEPWTPSVERRRPVVLVVDDERIIADSLAAILSAHGFAVLTAYDGGSALDVARVIPPELLISDVMMPGMSGTELAIALIELVPDCKVLLFSGQAATVDLLARARDQGHDFTLLAKPIHPTDMLRRISECLEYQR